MTRSRRRDALGSGWSSPRTESGSDPPVGLRRGDLRDDGRGVRRRARGRRGPPPSPPPLARVGLIRRRVRRRQVPPGRRVPPRRASSRRRRRSRRRGGRNAPRECRDAFLISGATTLGATLLLLLDGELVRRRRGGVDVFERAVVNFDRLTAAPPSPPHSPQLFSPGRSPPRIRRRPSPSAGSKVSPTSARRTPEPGS